MSPSFRLRSHTTPSEKKLVNHLENVGKLSKEIVSSKYIKHKSFFSRIAYLIGISHDFGKATRAFQKYLDSRERTKYAYHSFLSSLLGYWVIKNYLQTKDKLEEFWHLPPIVWLVINKHHTDIRNIRGTNGEISKLKDTETLKDQIKDITTNNLVEVKKIYNRLEEGCDIQKFLNIKKNLDGFTKCVEKDVKKMCRFMGKEKENEKLLEFYFYILFFYSVLLDADKLDASRMERLPERREKIPANIVDKYKEREFKTDGEENINKIREEAYQEVNSFFFNLNLEKDRILSINLPTGAGKTITCFSFALNLREKIREKMGFTPRIIYSLPFLSIIDQNSEVITDILKELVQYDNEVPSNLFLKQHHLADIGYKEEKNGELNIVEDIKTSLLLSEGWHSEIVITTFVQFFHSLITNRKRAARKFQNMSNSIIILDEIQSIPHKYWLLIREALKYTVKNLNCWVILMTATMPLIFKGTKELVKNREKYFESFDRVEYDFNLDGKDFENFKEEFFNLIMDKKNVNKDIMVVLNTINSCEKLYTYLKEKLCSEYNLNPENCIDNEGVCKLPELELIYMSTHILPKFRLSKIDRIKNSNKRKIIITTQLVEAGVSIDVDEIYRDFAPLDCIIQAAGRCNRNDSGQKGIVHVIVLKDENNKPFYSYIYDSTLIDITKQVINEIDEKSEREFTSTAIDKYYSLVTNRCSLDKSKKVIESLKKLNFSDISKFKLIEEKIPSLSIFVEIDKSAQDLREKIEELTRKNGYEKMANLRKMRKDLNKYTISINLSKKIKEKINHLPLIEGMIDFRYIPKKEIENWYKLDTGFCPLRVNSII